VRVSTVGQTRDNHSSLEIQESRYKEYRQRNDVLTVCQFVGVVPGRRDDRKEDRRMVEYTLHGDAEIIVVQFLDRFGRNPRVILQRYWELQDAGVAVVATEEDIREELLFIKVGNAGAESRGPRQRYAQTWVEP
jgi:DNA invertase Pin-like site-specific DNA recombinase